MTSERNLELAKIHFANSILQSWPWGQDEEINGADLVDFINNNIDFFELRNETQDDT